MSSGRAEPTGCTTGSGTAAPAGGGCWNGSRPETSTRLAPRLGEGFGFVPGSRKPPGRRPSVLERGTFPPHGLIDTTEMYLRTVVALEEEGIVPLRARIAERLSQSGPTVSQTVARMERDGLMRVEGDRQLSLTPTGRALATRVMRKHRLAECLLVSVIGLPWEDVHV